MNEHGAWTREFFQYEPFAAKQTHAQLFDKCNVQLSRGLRAQETVALDKNRLARLQLERLDVSWIGACKADFAVPARPEIGEKQAFTHHFTLQRSPYFLSESISAHARFPHHIGGFVNHFPGFGENLLSRL